MTKLAEYITLPGDVGAYPYQHIRMHRLGRRIALALKIVGGIAAGLFFLTAFIVHEAERSNRRRCRH